MAVRKFKPVGKIDLDSKKNLSKDLTLQENEDKKIVKKDANQDSSIDKNSNEEKLPLDNEKLTTIYKKIVANQAIQAQQISKLLKQNNNVLSKIADKSSRIKYP